jgi:hypothetical protein
MSSIFRHPKAVETNIFNRNEQWNKKWHSKNRYSGSSVIRTPGGPYNYVPNTAHGNYHESISSSSSYTVRYRIFALRSSTLALRDDILYVTYTMEFPLDGPDFPVIRTIPPPPPQYSPNDRPLNIDGWNMCCCWNHLGTEIFQWAAQLIGVCIDLPSV